MAKSFLKALAELARQGIKQARKSREIIIPPTSTNFRSSAKSLYSYEEGRFRKSTKNTE